MKMSVYRRRETQNWNPVEKLKSTAFFYEENKTFKDQFAREEGTIDQEVYIVESTSIKRSQQIINKILET